jgi:uncharacterized membrane protein
MDGNKDRYKALCQVGGKSGCLVFLLQSERSKTLNPLSDTMTTTDTHRSANAFARTARKVYNPIGFRKGYNFVLFFIFGGALMGFTLAQLPKLNFAGPCKSSLDCIYYTPGSIDKIGIEMHLATILPAAFLVCFQFVPVIRHTAILFHRLNGYIILLLSLVSTAGALMLVRNALGGQVEMHLLIVLVSTAFVVSLALAYYNIKRLQIEQHRAWMLRAWSYVRVRCSDTLKTDR